ncbi:hypothetical protein [Paracoccus salsus]|uniref:hypothetical protein n=1 Tax=Paracoccus salsus TaxID=2911061 RepID=UPI001F26D8E5|nr:hypothetical protein [Paracoccus salsus]MCF3974661.1 hypothetical protein [Paracoccus salsus]
MPQVAGVSLVSLFEAADRVNQALPAPFSRFVERFVALELESRTSADAIIHTGRIQSLDVAIAGQDVESFDLPFGKLKIPMITTGVPFRLAFRRAAVIADLEPGAGGWQFDLMLGEFELTLDGLTAADFIAESGTTPRHLAPKPGNPPAAIVGAAALRFERMATDQPVVTRFLDATGGGDPFVPDARTGAVTSVTLAPPHVLIGTSQFGLTVKNVLFDYSEEFSPAFVLARGQSADWVGLAIEEAAIYCPSNAVGKGGFSLSVRDLLIGDPLGLQAEIEVQFGASPLNPATFVFSQGGTDISGGFDFGDGTLAIQAAAGQSVELTASLTVPAPPAGSDITDYEAEFAFPGRSPQTGDSATGSVRHGDVLRITPIEVIGTGASARRLRKPEFSVRMVASGTAPRISVQIASTTLANVVDLTGPIDAITTLTLQAAAQPADPAASFAWSSPTLGFQRAGASFSIALPAEARGVHYILLRQTNAETSQSRIRLRLRDPGSDPLFVGCETGVFDATAPTVPLAPALVLGCYDLDAFHEHGRLDGANAMASISGTTVNTPAGTLAEVALYEGGTPAGFEEDRHVQIEFNFDESDPQRWGQAKPFNDRGSNLHEGLLRWAANYTGAKFVVIGRCDDIGSDSYNVGLAGRRRDAGVNLLRTPAGGEPAASGTVEGHQEQSLGGLDAATRALIEPDDAEASARLIMDVDVVDRSAWPRNPDGTGIRSSPPDPTREGVRERFRRVDIYAVGGSSAPEARRETSGAVAPTRRQVLVPATGREVLPADNADARADYRVLLKLGWDRPRFSGWEDIVPNLAEFEYAWTPSPADGISTTSEVLTVFGKWVYDDLTGFTEFLLGIKSDGDPDGLFDTEQPNLVAALTFGPMLASGVDFDTDAVESGVRLAALAAITGFAGVDFGGGGPLIAAGSGSAFTKLQAKAQTRTIADPLQSYKVQILTDYSNTVHINAGALGLRTDPDQPMKIKYTDVGVEFDNTDPDAPLIEKFGLAQSSKSMSIEDSGLWKIDGPLGRLLRITEFKMGTGSLWFEPTLAIAIDIGVVEVSEATFRVTFNTDANGNLSGSPEFSLRGLKASVDIPATVQGEGRIRIEDGGILRAGVDATLIPLQVRASVALAVGIPDDPPDFAPSLFLSLYGRVQFPGGIPLGPLPIAIHGFIGQVTINGTRDVAAVEDVVAREIGWWRKAPEDKYIPRKGQYAFGVGVVVGTLPDASFSFSATGMVVVAFPDVEVIFGVEIEILSLPDTTAKDKKDGQSASITGLVVINDTGVTVAVSATYTIPKLLILKVPFGARFPAPGSGSAYVRIGSDNGPGRAGEPVTITFLPGILDIKVWSFLMVEGGGLPGFGPNRDWNFDGFSIGFGAGAGFEWKAGPLELSVSGAIYVGMGTDPLFIKGGLYLRGSLDLVIVSASVDAAVVVSYYDPPGAADPVAAIEEARFCAEVDFFFFSVKGCITLDFGSAATFDAPDPPPPVAGISLADRLNRITGGATTGSPQAAAIYDFAEVNGQTVNRGAAPENNHTVWPDTVPVLNFRHFIEDKIPTGAQFDPGGQPAGERWFGSNRLRYAYRLMDVRLVKDSDGAPVTDPSGGALLSAWTHPPQRPADDSSGGGALSPSGAEVTHLQLLNREPWAWAQSTADGGAGQPGDPATIIRRVCEPVPPPRRSCLRGDETRILAPTVTRLRRLTPPPTPYPSHFQGNARSFLQAGTIEVTGNELVALVGATGGLFEAGTTRAVPATAIATGTVATGYRLPRMLRTDAGGGLVPTALPWRIELDRAVRTGVLTLMVCDSGEGSDTGAGCYQFEDLKAGQQAERFDLPPFVLTAVQDGAAPRRNLLQATDRIDISNIADPVFGSDGTTDVIVSDPGAEIALKRPCHRLEIHWFKPSDGVLVLRIHHADGTTTKQIEDTPPNRPALAILTSETGIVRVEMLTDGIKQFHLYRVCCTRPGQPDPDDRAACLDFASLNADLVNRAVFDHDGARFEALDAGQRFALRDAVDTVPEPDRFGQDGIGDLQIPFSGMRVTLPQPCMRVELSVVLGAREIKATGFDAGGNAVVSAGTPPTQGVGHTLTLAASVPIVSVMIEGGSGEAFLYRLCCLTRAATPEATCVAFDDVPRQIEGQREATHDGITLRTLARGDTLRRADQVDTTGAPRAGRDRRAELWVPDRGIELTLPSGCTEIELHVMLFAGPVKAVGFDAAGNAVARAEAEGQRVPHVMRLSGRVPIGRIVLAGGSNEAVLYRLCCRSGALVRPQNRCVSLEKLRLRRAVARIEHEGVTFRDPRGEPVLKALPGRGDRPGALVYGAAGLDIALSRPARNVRLHLLAKSGTRYQIEGYDARGARIAGEGGEAAGEALRVTLKAPGIARIEVRTKGVGGLVEICLRDDRRDTPFPVPRRESGLTRAAAATVPALPEVIGRLRAEGGTGNGWSPEIVASHQNRDGTVCHIVRYTMPSVPQAIDEIRLRTRRAGVDVTFIGLCAIDDKAAQWHAHDEEIRDEIQDQLDGADPLGGGRPVILEPGTTYRIEVDWKFQSWLSEKEDEQPPTTPDEADWKTGTTQVFRFRTADELVAPPSRQDGPNEHLFDARDLDRYLAASSPETGAIAHFTADPVVFHFTQDHVANLAAQYGRALEIELRRTDPPPQPGGSLGTAAAAPLVGTLHILAIDRQFLTPAERAITDAVRDAPCIDSERPVGGTAIAGVYPLEPNVFYDANLWAVRTSDSADRALVSAANFFTSRYANPTEMVEALGCSTDGSVAPSPAPELILEPGATLPAVPAPATPRGAEPPSDRLFDEAMNAMGLGTLGLPRDGARIIQIWEQQGATLACVGFLVDALEPLNRKAHVISGTEVVIADRCRLREGRYGGIELRVTRLSRNATRALLRPVSPIPAGVDPASFRLIFDTSEGTLTGRRQMRVRPLMLELEGF